jgi:hypothetical protein
MPGLDARTGEKVGIRPGAGGRPLLERPVR